MISVSYQNPVAGVKSSHYDRLQELSKDGITWNEFFPSIYHGVLSAFETGAKSSVNAVARVPQSVTQAAQTTTQVAKLGLGAGASITTGMLIALAVAGILLLRR